jgi:metal-sulfur cluster biosynthetic enzyme
MSEKQRIESSDTAIMPPNVPFAGKQPIEAAPSPPTHSSDAPVADGKEPMFAPVHTGLAGDPNELPPPPADETAMIDALKEVIDPELMINIVDLGLVYNITLDERTVHVEMTLTSPACPAGPQIVQQSKMALERLPGIEAANIRLVMSPPWSPARMTDEARDQLGIF